MAFGCKSGGATMIQSRGGRGGGGFCLLDPLKFFLCTKDILFETLQERFTSPSKKKKVPCGVMVLSIYYHCCCLSAVSLGTKISMIMRGILV